MNVAYLLLHHMRALPAHDLHVIVNKHTVLLLSTFQHGVDTNVRTGSPNASTGETKKNKKQK